MIKKNKYHVLTYTVLVTLLLSGLAWAAISNFSAIRVDTVAADSDAYQLSVYTSGTRVFSVDSVGNLYFGNPTVGVNASKTLATSEIWTLSAAEQATTLLTLAGFISGTVDIIAPDTTGKMFVVRNGMATVDATLKKSGGTGSTVSSGYTAIFVHNGTNYVRISNAAH